MAWTIRHRYQFTLDNNHTHTHTKIRINPQLNMYQLSIKPLFFCRSILDLQ
jgi:hypothetical protein